MKLALYGSGGLGLETLYHILHDGHSYSEIVFIDDIRGVCEIEGHRCMPFSVASEVLKIETTLFLICVGEPTERKILADKVQSAGFALASYLSENAYLTQSSAIASGCIVEDGCHIGPNVVIEENCVIMSGSYIGHHSKIARDTIVCPNAAIAGHCSVGSSSCIGIGSSIRDCTSIGDSVIVGAGSVVVQDVPNEAIACGNPACVQGASTGAKAFR